MHLGTIIEKQDEQGKVTFLISNDKGELEISQNQQDSDEIHLFVGNEVNYNVSFKARKPVIGDEVIISSIPLNQFADFIEEAVKVKKITGVIISELRNIYTIETKSGMCLLKRDSFVLTTKTNDLKLAVIQDIIDLQNKRHARPERKGNNSSTRDRTKSNSSTSR